MGYACFAILTNLNFKNDACFYFGGTCFPKLDSRFNGNSHHSKASLLFGCAQACSSTV
jgi:hypothetical protein